ncbi:MAG TPA: TlpA disulfide reductase family protein [Acetobacteraceae bacterium]|nr:TlpA disulfide reductase family protein [Acetobacteraceae bacterium]
MILKRREMLAGATLASVLLAGKRAAALGQIMRLEPPRAAPDAAFTTGDGKSRILADYKGKSLLVNLWATWCAPCVRELPSLAALAATLGKDGIDVLPISSDLGGAPTVEAFYRDHGIAGLPVLIDKDAALTHAFGARGLPTTYLIDPQGKIVGLEEGGMDWARPEVAEAVRRLLGGAPS